MDQSHSTLRGQPPAPRSTAPAERYGFSAFSPFTVGMDETREFLRQTDLLWDAWPANRPPAMHAPLRIPDRHHFNVVLDYAEPASALTRATLALF